MAQLSFIRRMFHRDGLTVHEISRRTKLSRNTIPKYLNSGVIEPRYPPRKSTSVLDPFAAQLASWLDVNQRSTRKRRRTLRQMHAALQAMGFTGSYDRVAAFARVWRQAELERTRTAGKVFVPLEFDPGEAFQFDWSDDEAVIAGKTVKLSVSQFKLAHSRAFVLRAYWHQRHEMHFARDVSNRVCFLDDGRILEEGPPQRMFSNPTNERTKRFLDRIIAAGRM